MRAKALFFGVIIFVLALVPAGPAAAQTAPGIVWKGGGTIGVQSVAVSPDGQTLATAGQDNTVKLWRTSDRSLIRTLISHDAAVWSVAFSPDGRFVASGGEFVFGDPSGNVKLWRVGDGAFLGDFPVPQSSLAYSVAISPDGMLLAAGLSGSKINIWRVSDRALLRTLNGHTDQVFSVAFSPNGQTLASGSADRTVRIWTVATGALQRTLQGHTSFVNGVAFSPDGTMLASASLDQTIRLWRVPGFSLLRTLRGHTDAVHTVAFSADNQTLASGGADKTVRLWRPGTGALLRTLTDPEQHVVYGVTFIGSATVASGGADSHARLWRVSDGSLTGVFGHHEASLRSVIFSPDGTLFASGSEDTTARLWRASDGADLQTLAEHIDVVNAVAFSPNGRLVATAAGSPPPDTRETKIKIWRVGTAASVLTLPGHQSGSTGVAFSADGQTLISAGRDFALRFWRVSDGSLIRAVTQGSPTGVLTISPDRSVVAVPGRATLTINLYSTADGTLLRTLRASTGAISSLSFSGDGRSLAVGEEAYGNNVEIFRVSDGTLVRTLPGDPNGFVQAVAFAPDGSTLASGSGFSRVIQLWDPATGALRAAYDGETGWGPFVHMAIAFSPDSKLFGYGRGDATVVMARIPSRRASQAAGRSWGRNGPRSFPASVAGFLPRSCLLRVIEGGLVEGANSVGLRRGPPDEAPFEGRGVVDRDVRDVRAEVEPARLSRDRVGTLARADQSEHLLDGVEGRSPLDGPPVGRQARGESLVPVDGDRVG